MPRPGPSKYRPLADYLAALPAETETTTLTLAQIEAIIGAPLPRSALRAPFWSNARRPRGVLAHVRAVHEAGWRTGGLRWAAGGVPAVAFVRADSTAQRSA